MRMKKYFGVILVGLALLALPACTTASAKKAMGEPMPEYQDTGFDSHASDVSKHPPPKVARVSEETDPEKAVGILVDQLQGEPAYAISAESQLKAWGQKQGVDQIIVRKVRRLLQYPKAEVRAPALRLTIAFMTNDSIGDLIECLTDPEDSIRMAAFKAIRNRTHKDFGFDPAGGVIARAQAVDEWRQWWQSEQRRQAVKPPSVYELNPPAEPQVTTPAEMEKKP
jgi:hypothetical protein